MTLKLSKLYWLLISEQKKSPDFRLSFVHSEGFEPSTLRAEI